VPTRLQLKGDTIEGLHARILNDYPPGTAIIGAERVQVGGIFGFLARTHVEAVVEVPDPATAAGGPVFPPLETAPARKKSATHPVPPRAGVAALLANADSAEAAMHNVAPSVQAAPEVSTATRSFDDLMESLDNSTLAVPGQDGQAAPVPAVRSAPGDAVLLVGVGGDALVTARSMAAAAGSSSVVTAGSYRSEGTEHIVSRQGLVAAQAAAVISGEPVFIAFGLGSDGSLRANALTELKADQVWIVVDATRKPTDTQAWVRKVGWSAPVNAMAVIGSQDTLTPSSVNDFDLPIGWIDGRKAHRSAL
jgi:hypothetical protein